VSVVRLVSPARRDYNRREPMRCPACGHDLIEASQFCPSCGARIGSSAAATLTVASSESFFHTSALDGAQFTPGTLLNARYRIVGLIGVAEWARCIARMI
jgi:hypothetical protein